MTDNARLPVQEGNNGSLTERQIEQTFAILGYDFSYGEQREEAIRYLDGFQRRWGALSADTLAMIARRAIPSRDSSMKLGSKIALEPQTSDEVDTLFSLAALGVLRFPEMSSLLLPYLASQRAQERWLAAYGLATQHNNEVLPALEQILVEFVGPNQPRRPDGSIISVFQDWRRWLVRILAKWKDPRIVPLLRAGLIATVLAEEIEVPEPSGPEQGFIWLGQRYTGQEAWQAFHNERMFWVDGEHDIVYALGQLGAFGALVGVPTRPGIYYWRPSWVSDGEGGYRLSGQVPESHAGDFRGNIWRVHACLGYLESRFSERLGTVYSFKDAPGSEADVEQLVAEMDRLLAGKFGLDEVARQQAMADYDQAGYTYATILYYKMVAQLAQQVQQQARAE